MARFCFIVAAIVCFMTNSVEAQQTNHEKLRAPLEREQPLVAPKPLLFWAERLSHTDPQIRQQAVDVWQRELEQMGLWDFIDGDSLKRQQAFRERCRPVLPILIDQLKRIDLSPAEVENEWYAFGTLLGLVAPERDYDVEWEIHSDAFGTLLLILGSMGTDARASIPILEQIAM
jgi:hypothetical protein